VRAILVSEGDAKVIEHALRCTSASAKNSAGRAMARRVLGTVEGQGHRTEPAVGSRWARVQALVASIVADECPDEEWAGSILANLWEAP